jgi:hypothetical protein
VSHYVLNRDNFLCLGWVLRLQLRSMAAPLGSSRASTREARNSVVGPSASEANLHLFPFRSRLNSGKLIVLETCAFELPKHWTRNVPMTSARARGPDRTLVPAPPIYPRACCAQNRLRRHTRTNLIHSNQSGASRGAPNCG